MSLFFGRRKKLIINEPDPEYEVVYLGNILTSIAKGDADKPLALIWRTYCAKVRPDLRMSLVVCRAGLRALTDQQGVTEYWAHRMTWCAAPDRYPRLFCWIYKHEGKKMKPELRCHAALCKRADQPARIASQLQARISQALCDYKREKLARQNWRLSASVGQPPVPRRRLLLNTGGQNFRPPMARSKSAPRLQSINEEDDEEAVPPHPPLIAVDSTPRLLLRHRLSDGDFLLNRSSNQFVSYFAQLSIDSQFEDDYNEVVFDCDSSNVTCDLPSTNGNPVLPLATPTFIESPPFTPSMCAGCTLPPNSSVVGLADTPPRCHWSNAHKPQPHLSPNPLRPHGDWPIKAPPPRSYSTPTARPTDCVCRATNQCDTLTCAIVSKCNSDVIDDVLLVEGSRGRDEDTVSEESGYHEEDKSSSYTYTGNGDDVEIIVSL